MPFDDSRMKFEPPFRRGVLIRRYKRFLADVEIEGQPETIHCANTGAMLGCSEPGSRVWFSTSNNAKRKYRHSLEIVETAKSHLAYVNTLRINRIVEEALTSRIIDIGANPGSKIVREVPIPGESGRFDFSVDEILIEVKSVTYERGGVGYFPDAVSVRATRHVRALERCRADGMRAILLFCVAHSGVNRVTTANRIDPVYASAVRDALDQGVEVIAFGCSISPVEIAVTHSIPFAM
jgi:sugar fermentation stimulation protein A